MEIEKSIPNGWQPVSREHVLFFTSANPFFKTGGEVQHYRRNDVSVVCFRHPQNVWQGQTFQSFSLVRGAGQHTSDLHALFDQIENDCQKNGMNQLVGPMLGKTCYNYRLTSKGAESKRMSFDPPFLPQLEDFLTQRGFKTQIPYSTDIIEDIPNLQSKARKRLSVLVSDDAGFQIVRPTAEVIRRDYESLPSLINRIFATNPYFVPLNDYDFKALYPLEMLLQSCSQTSFFIENHKQETIGFSFNFVDPHHPGRLLVKSFGILPEVSGRSRIFVKALFHLIENSGRYDEIAFCQMVSGNQVQRLTSKHAGQSIQYSLFVKSF